MSAHPPLGPRPIVIERPRESRPPMPPLQPTAAAGDKTADPQRNFRFFDNRQKYLLFVNTCSEKWEVAHRVSEELTHIHPRPPAVRLFDAGVGDGSVLTRVMRAAHDRFPHMPFYVVGKEISLEDVRLTLQKMSDRFFEHPATVLGADQSGLRRRAVAGREITQCRVQPGLARASDDRQFRAPVRAADHGSGAVSRARTGGPE